MKVRNNYKIERGLRFGIRKKFKTFKSDPSINFELYRKNTYSFTHKQNTFLSKM